MEQRSREIPVYLFTGFLEAGKTGVIQETMEDANFNSGEETLLLICEEGIEEYDLSAFASPNATLKVIDNPAQLTADYLKKLSDECKADRVMIEYNGMWTLENLYNALPETWMVYQELFLADATTVLTYNANMRSLMVDKLQSCEMAVFNRCNDSTDKMALHKLVRGVSRSAAIAYEYPDGRLEYDDIEDPLPFDINAPVIYIEDRDFAIWYRDMSEEPEKYVDKTLCFKGLVGRDASLGKHAFVAGRHIMTCCEADIAYRGLVCLSQKELPVKTKDWILLTAVLKMEYHKLYGTMGPVLHVVSYEKSGQPDNPVATFY